MIAKLKLVIPVREACFMSALVLKIIDRTLITGVYWIPSVSKGIYILHTPFVFLFFVNLAICFILDFYKNGRLFHLLAVIVFSLLVIPAYKTNETLLPYSAAMILSSRNVSFSRTIKVFYRTTLISFFILIIASLIHLTENTAIIFDSGTGYSFGMAHPNNFAAAAAVVLFAWSYHNMNKPLILISAVVWGGALAIYIVTISRTVFVILLAYPCTLYMYRLLNRVRGKYLFRMIPLGFVLIFTVSVYLMMYTNNEVIEASAFDKNLIQRFNSAWKLYNQYGIHLFGSHIEYRSIATAIQTGLDAVLLDSGYLFLLLSQGIISTIIVVLDFLFCMRILILKKKYKLILILSMFLLTGITERYMMDASMNFALLATFACHDCSETENIENTRRIIRFTFRSQAPHKPMEGFVKEHACDIKKQASKQNEI